MPRLLPLLGDAARNGQGHAGRRQRQRRAGRLTRGFDIDAELLVLLGGERRRNRLAPLRLEVTDIFAVDRLALVRGRIGTRDVELLVLHEIVIAVAAVRLAPSRKPRAAAGDQIAGFIAGQALGLRPLDTIFVIARPNRRWAGEKEN